MWIFTKYGFLNAVGARQGNGSHGQPVDPDTMMIRARLSAHLQALQERFPEHLAETEIQKTTGTDYAFRIFIPKTTWVTLLVLQFHFRERRPSGFVVAAFGDELVVTAPLGERQHSLGTGCVPQEQGDQQ